MVKSLARFVLPSLLRLLDFSTSSLTHRVQRGPDHLGEGLHHSLATILTARARNCSPLPFPYGNSDPWRARVVVAAVT